VTTSRLRFLTAGESHGPMLCAVLEGMPAGMPLSPADIDPDLARRQGIGAVETPYRGASARMRLERDSAEIQAGVIAGETTGAPIAILVRNRDHERWKGKPIEPMTVPRPGHADLVGALKYGYNDLRPSLERASARETAARVAVGAVCRALLQQFDVRVESYVVEIGGVPAAVSELPLAERRARAALSPLCCPDPAASDLMAERLDELMKAGDTAGGVFEVAAFGLPPGLGSYVHWDRRLSARLAAAVLGIPGIVGFETGGGFSAAARPGTEVHGGLDLDDEARLARKNDGTGGMEGGVTNGEPLVLRVAMKPLSTTVRSRQSVDLTSGASSPTKYQRSDFCAVPRVAVVAEAMVCYVLADALLEKLGGDSLSEMKARFPALRRSRLEDLPMLGEPRVLWP
jgi:chorismate synthase